MTENLLIVADSERDADMLYAVGMFIPDPFIYLHAGRRPVIVVSDLEFDRVRRGAGHCRVVSQGETVRTLQKSGVAKPDVSAVIRHLLRTYAVRKVTVPENFPLGIARRLQKLGVKVKPRVGDFFPDRRVKRLDEIKKISASLTMAEVGLAEAIHAIKNSRVGKNRRLIYRNAPLTSERVRGIIGTAVMQAGGVAANTIVSSGAQSCDPHERGHGVLRAGDPIILDVFPRSEKTGYYGDVTRTVVKGKATDAVRQLYRAVEEAQDLGFSLIHEGQSSSLIHDRIQQQFASAGYKTGRSARGMQGFFHGTGHGLGLDIHESLRIDPTSKDTLKTGHVVTVEPGLYYPGIGGVRLEDVALVLRRSSRNLTRFEKVLEI